MKAPVIAFPSSFPTSSEKETGEVGAALASLLLREPSLPRFIAMFGDLGAGKTAFTRGFVSVVSPKSAVKSPTFAIVREYTDGAVPVFHFDVYRIKDEDDLDSIGYYDYLSRGGIILCEWSENIRSSLPERRIEVAVSRVGDADSSSSTATENEKRMIDITLKR